MMRNTLKTTSLLSALAGFLVLIGGLLAGTTGVVLGAVAGFAIVGFSYWKSDALAIRAARAVPVTGEQLSWLQNDVADLARRAEMPAPRLYISDDAQPNAFATGRNEKAAVVCVTRGLIDHLERDEVRGVIAHELAHIRNKDILIGSIAAAIATGISAVANIAMFAGMFGHSDDEEGANPFAVLLLAMLAPIAGGLLQMAISRSREYEADRRGAALMGDPMPLARALRRLEAVSQRTPMDIAPAQASAWIVNPLTGRGRQANVARFFQTHPPIEDRVARLMAMDVSGDPAGAGRS